MELVLKKNVMYTFTCAILLLLTQHHALAESTEMNHEHNHNHHRNNHTEESGHSQNESRNIQRRQDNGFDFMSYFMKKNAQQQPPQQQEPLQQQPSQIQQQHLLQQQILQEQQRRQLEQLQQLQQQQQLIHHQQQQRTLPQDLGYQDNAVQQQYQQPQTLALNREGGYGGVGIGNGYSQGYAQHPREIGVNIGGKPVVQVGSILQLLPRIFNVLSAGGKVMFGVELGNNFYFGPVGAKPLGK